MAADEPVYDPGKMTYTLKLKPAKWSDGTDFTAEDVVFTGNMIKEFKIPRQQLQVEASSRTSWPWTNTRCALS